MFSNYETMKILIYNWAPLDLNIGGGVAVYVKNILDYLSKTADNDHIDVVFLSAGYYYDNSKKTYIRKDKNYKGYSVYTIINSPVIAPNGFPEKLYSHILDEEVLVKVIRNFVKETGPYDAIHFNSLEGLSPQVLSLKADFPNTIFVHSMHDYGVFCPRVQFWTKENENCVRNKDLHLCSKCMAEFQVLPVNILKRLRPSDCSNNRISLGIRMLRKFLVKTKIMTFINPAQEVTYKKYRKACIDNINNYVDKELVVSKRVGDIAKMYGVNPNIIKVSYIGTKVADTALGYNRYSPYSEALTLLYMGYMSKMKGFYYYLSILDGLDDEVASRIDLKFATKISDVNAYKHILSLKSKFHDIIFYDGYTHSDFPKIMENVNLGIVPPLWEDNLPQVTMEMIANGIPVITSNNGGAHELNTHPDFVFISKSDCINKINKIANDRKLLEDYWNHSVPLTTMEQHVGQLIDVYSGQS